MSQNTGDVERLIFAESLVSPRLPQIFHEKLQGGAGIDPDQLLKESVHVASCHGAKQTEDQSSVTIEKPRDQRQYRAEQDAGYNREVERSAAALHFDIAGQRTQPDSNTFRANDEQSGNNQHNSRADKHASHSSIMASSEA